MSGQRVKSCLYFDSAGPKNTEALLEFAGARFKEEGLDKVVIASSTGRTAETALNYFDPADCRVVMVSYVYGFDGPDTQRLEDAQRRKLEERGVSIVTAAHAFGGVGRGVRNKLGAYQVDEIMAYTLRMFGQGVKVGVEISLMAADRGLVRTDEFHMAIAGSGKGADTAMIVQPAASANCLDAKIKEIVAKPRFGSD
jgi:hypothetical protein